MTTEALQEIKKIIEHVQHAVQVLDLSEKRKFTSDEIEIFKKEFPFSVWGSYSGKHFDPKQKDDYKSYAGVILDFFSFNVPNLLLEKFADCKEFDSTVGKAIRDFLEEKGVNSMARYLGEYFVPNFVNDEKLYKKMLWLEWILTNLVKLASHVDGMITRKLIVSQLDKRLNGTKSFLKKYAETNPHSSEQIIKFRKAHQKVDEKDSIDNQYNRALLVLKADYLSLKADAKPSEAKTDIKVESTQPVVTAPTIDAKNSIAPKPITSEATPVTIKTKPKPSVTIEEAKEPEIINPLPCSNETAYEFRARTDDPVFEEQFHTLRVESYLSKDDLYWKNYLENNKPIDTLTLLKEAAYEYKVYLDNLKDFTYTSEKNVSSKKNIVNHLLSSQSVTEFKKILNKGKNELVKNRDTGTVKFLKAVATILTAGLAALFGIWNVKGSKSVSKMDNILKKSAKV